MKVWGKRIFLILAAAAAFLGILGFLICRKPSTVTIFYPDKNELVLVPVTRIVKTRSPETVLAELEKGPKDTAVFLPALSAQETPLTLTTQGHTILVNFEKKPDFKKFPLLIDCLLASLKQLPRYNTVKFLVQGRMNAVVDDQELGEESFSNFHVNNNFRQNTSFASSVTVYYLLRGSRYLVPVTQWIPSTASEMTAIAQALQGGEGMAWALQPPLPPGSKILSVTRSRHNVKITLSLTGSAQEQDLAREAILFTYTELPSIRTVQFRVKVANVEDRRSYDFATERDTSWPRNRTAPFRVENPPSPSGWSSPLARPLLINQEE